MKNFKRSLLILLVAYILVIGVNLAANYDSYASGGDWKVSMSFSLLVTTIGTLGAGVILPAIFKRFDWYKNPTQKMLLSVVIFALYGAALMIGPMVVMGWIMGKGLPLGEYLNNASYSILLAVVIGLMVNSQRFLITLKKSIEDNERMKHEMIQSQYETLKNQVNPHFLFNSLNTLTVMIPQQPQVAVSFVEQLSKVFRYSLQHSGENAMSVAAEIKVVRSYLFLNEQRYGNKLVVDINIDNAAMQQKVITQSLLMLAENAIKHNELSHENPLTVSIYNEGAYLVVRNTLQRKTLIEQSTHVGLNNIKSRYGLATATPIVIEEGGDTFTVKIPLLS